MYTIIDTETTGLFDFNKPAHADGQPRLASFAMLAADADCRLICATHVLVRPDGWQMGAEAESINGLSQQMLEEHGVPVGQVLVRYAHEVMGGGVIVGHNVDYDAKIMRGELRRARMSDFKGRTPTICTMRALTDVLQIPKASGRGYKWPKLAEAVRVCMGREPLGAHGALHDALDCLDLMRWLKDRGLLPEPKGVLAA
ncbi:3'-5' exonuclease [Bradyrhizobium sp. RT9a]|uniref:3'-5' exonuclease n=1 Tax=Bradyrhizobium sp. RT9a TaxID=3156384 RepID=UPI003394F089